MAGKVMEGPITIRGDLIVTGRLNKGLDTAQANNGKALQVIQGVLQPVVTQPHVVPASGDVRMYGQNTTINGNVVPGGADGYFQIDEYINGAWQHLFEIQPSTTGNANVLDMFISGRLFARDSLLSAPGRFFFKALANPFGSNQVISSAFGNGVFIAGGGTMVARSTDMGQNWNSVTDPFNSTMLALAYGNSIFIASGINSGTGYISRSTDYGVSWSGLISLPFGAGNYPTAIAFGNGVFVVAGDNGRISRSTDNGVTWSALISNNFGTSRILSLSYGNGIFVATALSGKVSRSLDNGVTWSALLSVSFGTDPVAASAYGNGVFIIVGGGGGGSKISRSVDGGSSWSSVSNPFTGELMSAAFGGGYFIVGGLSQVARSLDLGVTWGIKNGDLSTASPISSWVYTIAISPAGNAILGGIDAGNTLAYTDYVEAGAGIVESGSNTNGSYIKFSDGTITQYGFVASYYALPTTPGGWRIISTPANFITKLAGTGSLSATPGQWLAVSAVFSDEQPALNSLAVYNRGAYAGDSTINWIAHGRWK